MNNDNSTPRLTNAGPVLRTMGLDSTLPDHTLVVIIVRLAFVLDESTHVLATLIPHPNHNTNEIPVLRSMGLDSTLPEHTLIVIIVRLAFALNESTHMPATLIPHPNHNMNEIVVHDHMHANQDPVLLLHHNNSLVLQHNLSDIIDLTIIFFIKTRFRNVDGAPGDWSSNMRAAATTLLAFFRDPDIFWACVFGGLVRVVVGLIKHNF
ncbi:hypothetical protein B0H11DRAFT_2265909 [Mycena galericulata]|nr:hypothetical protein B0H11DRAFT_2265909 [Mycena galericulata]